MNLIMPGKLCAGSLVSSGDRAGCVISRGLAGKLNLDGIGGVLQVLGREYQIRGILDVTDAVCIIQGDTGTQYSRVQVKYENMPASGALLWSGGPVPHGSPVGLICTGRSQASADISQCRVEELGKGNLQYLFSCGSDCRNQHSGVFQFPLFR